MFALASCVSRDVTYSILLIKVSLKVVTHFFQKISNFNVFECELKRKFKTSLVNHKYSIQYSPAVLWNWIDGLLPFLFVAAQTYLT